MNDERDHVTRAKVGERALPERGHHVVGEPLPVAAQRLHAPLYPVVLLF